MRPPAAASVWPGLAAVRYMTLSDCRPRHRSPSYVQARPAHNGLQDADRARPPLPPPAAPPRAGHRRRPLHACDRPVQGRVQYRGAAVCRVAAGADVSGCGLWDLVQSSSPATSMARPARPPGESHADVGPSRVPLVMSKSDVGADTCSAPPQHDARRDRPADARPHPVRADQP